MLVFDFCNSENSFDNYLIPMWVNPGFTASYALPADNE
jgi:hypothetical protein